MKIKTKQLSQWAIAAAMAASVMASASAGVLVGQTPFTGSAWGQQTDGNSGPAYSQSIAAPNGAVLDAIRWWGFHTVNSGGAAFDNFVVTLDGVVQAGVLTVTAATADYDEYTLDVANVALTASSLAIVNDSFDVEWFWQSAEAVGNAGAPDASRVAFSLLGTVGGGNTVPEPSMLGLLAMGALGLLLRPGSKR